MDAPFLSLVSNPVATASATAPAPAAADGQGVSGADFAQLLSQMMASAQRQGLAAGTSASLQAVALSPNIEVITADAPLPDNDSLLAFARSQGLDDGMIGALFVPAADAEAASAAGGLNAPGLALAQALAAQWGATVPASVQGAAGTPGLPAGAPGSDRSQAPPAQAEAAAATLTLMTPAVPQPALAPASGAIVAAPVLSAGAAPGAPQPGAGPAMAAIRVQAAAVTAQAAPVRGLPQALDLSAPADAGGRPEAPTVASLAALGAAALRRLDVQWAAAGTPAAAPVEASAQAQTLAAAPALHNVLRLRLQPQEAITRRLADLAASGQQAIWAELSGPAAAEADLLHLDLGELSAQAVDELANESPALPAPQAGHLAAGRHPASSALPQPAQDPAGLPDRAAQYEQLAQRLGEALGQRLQAQIERGQWKVQMQVDPASLGRIDMELDMRAGGLDAVFRSDNALTRELISQGLPRLRESLAQSGTAVASVWVQGDAGRQSGGNPTPGRWQAPGRAGSGKEDEVSAEPSPVQARASSSSAWDLLA